MIIDYISHFIALNPELSVFYLIGAKIIGAVLFFPGAPLTLLAGATFGTFYGSIISLIGNVLGASSAFFISRYCLREYVTKTLYKKYPKIQDYESKFFSNGLFTVLFLRLIPLFPFNVLNYVLGVTRVSTRDYLIGTAIGIIPGTIAFVYFGESLRMLSPLHISLSLLAIIGLTYIGKRYEKKYR